MQLELVKSFSKGKAVTLKVNGECMHPIVKSGALLRVKSARLYFPGDIVVYARADDVLVSHRALGYLFGRHGWSLICRADNSASADSPVKLNRVVGKVISISGSPFQISPGGRTKYIVNYLSALNLSFQKRLAGFTGKVRTS